MNAERFFTHSLRDPRVARILAAALDAVDPDAAVARYLSANPLPASGRVFALGLGKAAVPMTRALSRFTTLTDALVITKHASSLDIEHATLIESGHPIPYNRSLSAGEAALDFVSALNEDDLLVCLISGGGSALMTAPTVPLEDMQALTSALLACGARIDEINALRRHLDRVKGGGIAKATEARVLSLILSDVVNSPLEAIASGPTAPDPTTKEDALGVLEKYDRLHKPQSHPGPTGNAGAGKAAESQRKNKTNLHDSVSPWQESILVSLRSSPETLKRDSSIFSRVKNVIVGDNALAANAALKQAGHEGFQTESLGSNWQGEAREIGLELARKLRVTTKSRSHPFCLIAGGETTVTIKGQGKGGRNQELALASVPELAGLENATLITLATDGEDGPTDAAGAVMTGETLQRARSLGLDPADYLARNDSYNFFGELDDLLRIGPTGTNVNDLVFLISLTKS
jgi:hydroxypyruvate reductase